MHFKPVSLSSALRPSLFPDETLLFVQNAVGLYEGKFKIPQYQDGHAYLTSQRICYIDDHEPRSHCVAIDLEDVEHFDIQVRFLKSSPKITLYAKPTKAHVGASSGPGTHSSSPLAQTVQPLRELVSSDPPDLSTATWVCPICSFSNPVPSNFEPGKPWSSSLIPSCLNCGIKPPPTTILKAAISTASKRSDQPRQQRHGDSPLQNDNGTDQTVPDSGAAEEEDNVCPRCTFRNHISLRSCEICGAPLSRGNVQLPSADGNSRIRLDSPGPFLKQHDATGAGNLESIKISFRSGGEKIFFEKLKGAMVQKKWLLRNAPPVPKPAQYFAGISSPDPLQQNPQTPPSRSQAVGIAGLERRGLEARQNNEQVIGSAFGDLEALMASAKEVLQLAETFADNAGNSSQDSSDTRATLSDSAAALGMVTTKDMLSGSDTVYLSELSRNLAEYLTDDRKGALRKEGGILSLVDLWAVFNRSRNGVELVSPTDFQRAAELWEKLKLPVRLRRFKSGLLAVQRSDWTDEKIIGQLRSWLQEIRLTPPSEAVPWDWTTFGRGVTAQEAAQKFGWSVGVANEELEMAEDNGLLCREEGIEGLKFWSNYLLPEDLSMQEET
ncbi:MAG: hypothetical protein Q9227_009019 [Pyrenula ochraceoflavens]